MILEATLICILCIFYNILLCWQNYSNTESLRKIRLYRMINGIYLYEIKWIMSIIFIDRFFQHLSSLQLLIRAGGRRSILKFKLKAPQALFTTMLKCQRQGTTPNASTSPTWYGKLGKPSLLEVDHIRGSMKNPLCHTWN